jgi:hypothetical protein
MIAADPLTVTIGWCFAGLELAVLILWLWLRR